MGMVTLRRLAGIAALAALIATAVPAAGADRALIEAAKKEGRVTWYTSLIVNQFVRPAAAAFERKYGIPIDFVRSDPDAIALRIVAEEKAGHVLGDIFDGFGMPQLVKAGYVASWLPDRVKSWPRQYVDPAGFWLSTNFFVLTPGFNTDLVAKGTEPRTFEALLDPKWKGKLAWSSRQSASSAVGFIGGVLTEMGEAKGLAYLTKLAKQNIVNLDASARQVLDEVIAGEYPLALQIFNHHAVISAGKGAPVDWVRFDPTMVVLCVFQLTAHGPHPNAAKLMLDFLASEEGQKLFRDAGYMPVDPGVPLRDPTLRPDVGKFRANYFTPEQLSAGQAHWAEIYKKLFR
jgi:iron(III) transport system substrate-binding protein